MSANIPDDIKPAKEVIERSQAAEIARFAPSTDLWSLYLQEANERAKARFDMWNGSLGAFLLFAGLFAGVVSSFVIDSRGGLQPNPSVNLPSNSSNTNNPGTKVPISTLAINFLWFTSLTFTLISALAAVLAQTWIVKFSLVPTQGFKGAMERWIHDDKAEQWHLHTAIAWITVLIQLALFLFLAGFAVQAVADHKSLGWTILSFVGATLVLYIGITVLPWFYPTTPFRTPFSELGTRNQNMFFSDASNLTPATKAKNRTRDIWKFIQSIWTNLGKTPEEAEVRLGICWSVLKNSSKNVSIHAAVLELSKKRITPEQSRQLVELGLPDELSYRLAHLPAGQEEAVVGRMKDYLHVVMWMVDECDADVTQGFSPLLDCDDALLLTLDALPPVCRALAFAIRVHLLVNMSNHGKIHGTDWTAMIDSLEPDFALDIFRAAIRGLGNDSDDDQVKPELAHLRQDCARMLAAYIGSARFSNERLVASRITGDLLRIPRIQQESMKHIPTFFSQLEEAWKRSMCTRAIRLMEEVRSDRQIMGFQMLSLVAKNETFREAVNDVLPELGNTLQKVDWKTSVDCLGRLSEILKQDSRGTFCQAIKAIFPKIIGLLSDSGEEVRTAVLHLADQMDTQAGVVKEIDRISCELMKDLWSSSWRIRVARLQSLAELIKTDKISTAIIGQAQSIVECTSFYDEDVRLAAIRTLRELAKHERFQLIIHNNMSEILRLVSDEDSSVRAAAIDFVSELAGNASFQSAINRNIPAFITDNFKSEDWFVRDGILRALGKIISSGQSYDKGIQNAFRDMPNWLSDPVKDVRQTAVQIVSFAAGNAAFSDTIKNAIPKIAKMFQDEDEDVRVAALNTCSEIVKVQQVPLKETISRTVPNVLLALNSSSRTQIATLDTLSTLAETDDLTTAIPIIAKLFKAEGEDVRVAALGTCSDIAKIQRAALRNAVKNIMPEILSALDSSSGWETQIAALKTISTLAETDGLCETLNDNALDRIFAGLSDNDSDVCTQVLDTLTVLASKERLRDKIKTAVRNMLPLLEDWRWTVREKALDTFAVFAQQGIFLASDDEITSHIISTLSEGDNDISTRVLNILSIAAKEGVAPVIHPEISLVTNSLSHQNWRVRVAGLQILEGLADDTKYGKISFPAQATIVDCLSDKFEEVQLAGLRTLFKFIDNEIFRDRVTVPDTVPAVISSLLQSDSEDIRISAINIISTYITKAEFYSVIIDVIPAIIKLLDGPDEDSRVGMLQTVCSLANTEKFCTKDVFVKAIRHILPLLLSDRHAAVRTAALQIVPVISKHDIFSGIITDSLQVLLKVTVRKEDLAGTVEEVDEIFRIEVLKTLSDLAKNETFRGKIDIGLSESYTLATKDGSWPTRVAFLKLMSVLGASAKDALKSTVKQMMPDINDTLHDNENSEVRMAGVKLLSISVVKEISPSEFNSLVPILVTLLSDSEEEVRITALQTVSDLAKQDVFREAINRTLPALLEALKREEPNTRVAALRTCAALAQDATFCDIVHRAAPQITACVKDDPDDDVQVAAMVTVSQLSREEAFRLPVSEAAPHVMSQLENRYWSVRLEALRTLSIFAENDAFGDIINGFFPRILECLKDPDDDVRAEASKMLLSLVQHSVYRASIRGALQASGVSLLLELTSDHFRHVRLAVLPLILKVVELDTFPEAAAVVMSTIIKLLTDDDEEVRVVALEAIRALVEQGVSYAKELTPEIPKLTQLLKPDDSESRVLTTVLLTLSAMVTQEESVDTAMDVIPTMCSVFKDTKEPEFWDAAAKVFLALSSTGGGPDDKVHKVISSCVTSALEHPNSRARILGLNVLLGLNDQEIFESEFNNCRPAVLEFVESTDLDVRLLAIRVAGSFNVLDPGDGEKLHAATQKAWREVLTDIKSTSPSVVASEKLSKLADYVDVFVDEEFTDVIPLITAALKDERQGIALSYLRALLKLAADYRFREALVQVVPRITALLGNKKSDTQIRLEVLQNLLKLAEYQKFRVKIQEQVSAIISVLKDRDSNIRVTGLKVLLKLVQEVSPEKFPDRIKSTMPTLLTLIQSVATREDSVALVTCLAGDKTLRAEVLAKILPSILSSSQSPTSWGHLCLIARLFEHKRLKLEESDLRFFLCLMTSKKTEVQDFVLKSMTTTLQQYLVETWMNAQTFPPSFSSAFSSLARLKR